MENNSEINSFALKYKIEQTPYEGSVAQSFFGEWCRINDHLEPEFIDRNDWDNRGGLSGLLEKKKNGKRALYIPQDLHLWEMVGVMEAIDTSTYKLSPEKQKAKKEELIKLGKMFENAGVYIAKRIDTIEHGTDIAESLAEDFFNYGMTLVDGKKQDFDIPCESFAVVELTADETRDVDKWLAGDDLYNKRFSKLAKDENGEVEMKEEEQLRQETLAQFFRVAQKAFDRQKKRGSAELDVPNLKPWESATPVDTAFLNKIDANMTRVIETPKREFESSIFRRGMELLKRVMPVDNLPLEIRMAIHNWDDHAETLRDVLNLDEVKKDLDKLRREGNKDEIAKKERVIAYNIQKAVSSYPYSLDANNPSEMVINQEINCVGASMLGGSMLSEVGINYLVGHIPAHSILLLVTSSGEIEYLDMLDPWKRHKLEQDSISGKKKDGSRINLADVLAFSKDPKQEVLNFELISEDFISYDNLFKKQVTPISIYGPGFGQELQVLNNLALSYNDNKQIEDSVFISEKAYNLSPNDPAILKNYAVGLIDLGKKDEVLEIYKKAIAENPYSHIFYSDLGDICIELERFEDSIAAYRKAIKFGSDDIDIIYKLGKALGKVGKLDEAVEEFQKALSLDSDYVPAYMMLGNAYAKNGKIDDAIDVFEKIGKLADPIEYRDLIKEAKRKIEYLNNKYNKSSLNLVKVS
jgi:tetratricopeptide (TPR) repeat protein